MSIEAFLEEFALASSASFHFLRPEWFYAFIPIIVLFILLRYRMSHHSNWEKSIDPHLLPHLLDNPNKLASRSPLTLVLVAWIIATIALAGPVWRKTPQPVHEREDALVIIFDLTKSMLATDVKPNRLVRAKRKLIDLLEMRDEGVTALVVFSGDAHTVSPLTDDTNTIVAMIPALSPSIVPAPGSALAPALTKAFSLFRDAGVSSGRILIITDEIRDVVAAQTLARSQRNIYPVSVMSVGTAEGAPIQLGSSNASGSNTGSTDGNDDASNQSAFLKDASGRLVIPKLDAQNLKDFADLAGGRYSPMTLTDEDLGYLLADQPLQVDERYRELERDFDVWFEEGPWLLLLLLPLCAFAFRRGWVWSVALLIIMPVDKASAFGWDDLWQTKDEQAMNALANGDAETAARLFENQAWKATANYRNEQFEDAANQFGSIESSDGQFNLGNAFAKQGLFDEAIEAYDKALAQNPGNEDAQFNKALIEKLMEQQEQEQQEQNDEDSENEDQNDQEQDQQEQDQDEQQDQKDQGEQSEEQKQQEQKDQEQKEQEQKEQEEREQAEKEQQASEEDAAPLDEEEQQALEQWLRRVPDDPGGLLRQKFQQQYDQRIREGELKTNETTTDW